MLKQLWCPENNRILVCVDTYESSVPKGRFYNSLQESEEFSSLSHLLIRIEAMLDEQRMPQSYTTHRTFAAVMDLLEGGKSPATNRKGCAATFELKILFRQPGRYAVHGSGHCVAVPGWQNYPGNCSASCRQPRPDGKDSGNSLMR